MNKKIKGWYTAVMGAELGIVFLEALIYFGNIALGNSNAYNEVRLASLMFFAGVWLPILVGFIGKCFETKFKHLKAMPVATAIPLVLSVFGYLWLKSHPKGGALSGLYGLSRGVFYIICGFISIFNLIFAFVHVCEIRKDKNIYAGFLAMPNYLFKGKSVLLIVPLICLTAACLIPAVSEYVGSF